VVKSGNALKKLSIPHISPVPLAADGILQRRRFVGIFPANGRNLKESRLARRPQPDVSVDHHRGRAVPQDDGFILIVTVFPHIPDNAIKHLYLNREQIPERRGRLNVFYEHI